jgi:ABC-type transport system substrate-binding protein
MFKGLDTCIVAQTGPVLELNPFVSTSYYDLTAFGVLYPGLNRKNNMVDAQMEPMLATNWTVAADGKTWTVTLRQDAFWDDGQQVTADDVVFSYQSVFDPDLACQAYGGYVSVFGAPENIVKIDDFTVEFRLPQIYALFDTLFLDDNIVPKHIFENIPYADWRTHGTNTGLGNPNIVGCGPYSWVGLDETTSTFKFEKNDNYFKADELEADGYFQVEDYWVTFIEGWEAALAALKNGDVHFLDSQYHPEGHLAELDEGVDEGWCAYTLYSSNGYQELGFNCQHPVWGTGVDTPLGQSDPSRAAEAARYLRQAVSHCIPRTQIVYEILGGVGQAGDQHSFPGQPERRDDLLPYEFNLTRARELIEMAGYSLAPPAPTFLEQYGIWLAFGAGLVIAIAGTYFLRRQD